MAAGKLKPTGPAIPFTVIGGFLGSGKTTFLNHLLVQPDTPPLAVLVNDFGDIVIDQSLIKEHGGKTIALKNGCVCCSIGNDFSRALSDAIKASPRPQHIIVEASGVANPARIMDVARISTELQAEAVIVMVDAPALSAQLEDRWVSDTVRLQLASADIFVLSKTGEIEGAILQQRLAFLHTHYPETLVAEDIDQCLDMLGGVVFQPGVDTEMRQPHAHFETRSIVTHSEVDPARLQRWLRQRDDVYRLKGWIKVAPGDYRLVQAVGRRLNWGRADFDHDENTTLLVIGRSSLPAAELIERSLHKQK